MNCNISTLGSESEPMKLDDEISEKIKIGLNKILTDHNHKIKRLRIPENKL